MSPRCAWKYQRRSLTLFAFVQAYVAEVIRYTEVIRYRAKIAEIDRIWVQREELQRRCYMVGLEMGLSRQRLQEVRAVQRIIKDMVQDTRTNQQSRQRGQRGRGRPA